MVSQSAMHCMRSGIRCTSNSTSGNSACSSVTLGSDLFRMVSRDSPLDARCFTSSLDIFPAPTMHTCSVHGSAQMMKPVAISPGHES